MNIEKAKEEIQQLADKLKAELDAQKEFPQAGDWYWTIATGSGIPLELCWGDTPVERVLKSIGWIWRTEDEAQEHFNMLQATERVRQYIAKANGDWIADFSDDTQQKSTWLYNHKRGDFYRQPSQFIQKAEAWRYIKPELFDQLIADCGSDILLIIEVIE